MDQAIYVETILQINEAENEGRDFILNLLHCLKSKSNLEVSYKLNNQSFKQNEFFKEKLDW